jgi:hypothetical protein
VHQELAPPLERCLVPRCLSEFVEQLVAQVLVFAAEADAGVHDGDQRSLPLAVGAIRAGFCENAGREAISDPVQQEAAAVGQVHGDSVA